MSDQSNARVAEIVSFKLVEGARDDAFLAQMQRSDAYISGCAGFVDRRVAKSDEGQWTDLVTWRDMESAKAAFDGFMAQDFAADLVAMIDPATMQMSHQNIMWQSS